MTEIKDMKGEGRDSDRAPLSHGGKVGKSKAMLIGGVALAIAICC